MIRWWSKTDFMQWTDQNLFKFSYWRVWQTARETKDEKVRELKHNPCFTRPQCACQAGLLLFPDCTETNANTATHMQRHKKKNILIHSPTQLQVRPHETFTFSVCMLTIITLWPLGMESVGRADTERQRKAKAWKWDEVMERGRCAEGHWKQGGLRDCKTGEMYSVWDEDKWWRGDGNTQRV